MLRRFPRRSRVLASLTIVLFVLPLSALAADWATAVHELSQQIAASTGPGAVSLEVASRSSLDKADVDAIRAALNSQLSALGLRFVNPEQAAANVQVTLSENLQNYLWVARVQQGSAPPAVLMISLPRSEPAATVREPAVLLIRRIQLWSQADRILDVGVIDSSPPHIVVLDPNKIAVYAFQNNRWEQQQSLPIQHSRSWPRDMRGRIVLRKDHLFDAYLPGVFCASTTSSPLTITCHDTDDPWPVASDTAGLNAFFAPKRNYFTGALSPGIGKQTTVSAFYSGAAIPRGSYVLWMLAGVDGQVHEADGVNDQAIPRLGWGSDLASVKTSCGSGIQVLAASNGDGTTADYVRAYEVPDREPVPVSQPVELNGPVTALWSETAGTGAVVVTRNLQTGKYEPVRLAITCGQ
jgi:hypothetical protein